ncbi:hypothetical protein GCM10009821_08030 [Aeromicrobium halocynthiae]|uniref:Uncharacterized protein n=1 Tax=Aeromicrobium halocynthiae TaxID=560557 RepID=A0ABN2VTP9_9ACTN
MTEEPVSEGRVLGVGIVQGIDSVRLDPLSGRDGFLEPAVVRLTRKLQNPARNRDGNPACGQLAHERVDHFDKPPSFKFA